MKTLTLFAVLGLLGAAVCYAGPNEEIFAAVRSGNRTEVKRLVSKNKTLVFATDKRGMTPFLTAVEAKDLDMAYLLSDYFSRLGDSAAPGNAMHIAVNNEDEPMIKLLFRLTSEEDPELPKQLINMPRSREDEISITSSDRNTPLHIAAKKCNARIYKYLVANGANPDAFNSYNQTPRSIMAACEKTKAFQAEQAKKKAAQQQRQAAQRRSAAAPGAASAAVSAQE